jgi:hypothetical protein
MASERSKNELTTTLHLGLREVSNSPANHLEEQLATLSEKDPDFSSPLKVYPSDDLQIVRSS